MKGVVLPALALAALAAGCDSGGDPEPAPREQPADAKVIRGWAAAVNDGSYDAAASFFARGAIVEQSQAVRLATREQAVAFNRSLPCRSTVTGVREEGRTTVASFKLRVGPAGTRANCDSTVRVRFTIERGKFTVFRQLPEKPQPQGQAA